MSPLLFLAIAVVVPLLGMLVLGVTARLKRNRVTDDETGPFRRRLESIAPAESTDSPSPPGSMGPGSMGPGEPTSTSIRLVEREYSVPSLPPLSVELETEPAPRGRSPQPPPSQLRTERSRDQRAVERHQRNHSGT